MSPKMALYFISFSFFFLTTISFDFFLLKIEMFIWIFISAALLQALTFVNTVQIKLD